MPLLCCISRLWQLYRFVPGCAADTSMDVLLSEVQSKFPHITRTALCRIMQFSYPSCPKKRVLSKNKLFYYGLVRRPQVSFLGSALSDFHWGRAVGVRWGRAGQGRVEWSMGVAQGQGVGWGRAGWGSWCYECLLPCTVDSWGDLSVCFGVWAPMAACFNSSLHFSLTISVITQWCLVFLATALVKHWVLMSLMKSRRRLSVSCAGRVT